LPSPRIRKKTAPMGGFFYVKRQQMVIVAAMLTVSIDGTDCVPALNSFSRAVCKYFFRVCI